jgi:hypothetical protein
MMSALSISCKLLRSSVELHLQPYAQSITLQRWDRLPRPFVKLVFADALRMKIDGITKKMAMAMMIPESALRNLHYTERHFSRRCTAHVYTVPTIFSHLSSIYPAVTDYETALENKYQASNNARLKREENKRLRTEREAEIQDILKECHVSTMEYKRDTNLMDLAKRYVAHGSKKNRIKFTEDARVMGMKNARKAEVDELMKVNGVSARTIAHAEKEEYATTGDGDILERITMSIQEEKERLGRREDYRKMFHQTLLKLTGNEEWILQVPVYVWTRDAIIQEYLEYGTGEDDAVEDACSAIVSVLRAVKEEGEEKAKEGGSKAIHKYAAKLRREDLVAELHQHNLTLRSDSTFCQHFIAGTTNACVQQVVATMALSSHLFTWGHRCWSNNSYELESVMKKRYDSGECGSWYDAFESVKPLVDHSYYDDDDDDDGDDRYYDSDIDYEARRDYYAQFRP